MLIFLSDLLNRFLFYVGDWINTDGYVVQFGSGWKRSQKR